VGSVAGGAVGWDVGGALGWDDGVAAGWDDGEAACAAEADGDKPDPYTHWGVGEALAQALSIKVVAAKTAAIRRLRPSRGTESSPSFDRGLGALAAPLCHPGTTDGAIRRGIFRGSFSPTSTAATMAGCH
jgi:hypothetical protein